MNSFLMRIASFAVIVANLAAAELTLPSGTRVSCRLDQTISSATAEVGQPVQLSVTEAVKVNGVTVIPQGAAVVGSVVTAQEKRTMGRTGKLDFSIDKVRASNGEYIPLRYTMQKREGGSKGVSTGVITAGVAVLFWPAAPFVLLRKGKDITLNRGMSFEVFTDQDFAVQAQVSSNTPVQPSPGIIQPSTAPQMVLASNPAAPQVTASGDPATVNINADLSGSEVEVDGVYVGSTPAVARLSPGMHKITVRHGQAMWSRDLMVQPSGSVNVNAILRK